MFKKLFCKNKKTCDFPHDTELNEIIKFCEKIKNNYGVQSRFYYEIDSRDFKAEYKLYISYINEQLRKKSLHEILKGLPYLENFISHKKSLEKYNESV